MYYRETPKQPDETWPPRYMKVHSTLRLRFVRAVLTPTQFILHLADPNDEGVETLELAFLDARRLGRIRLCAEPLSEPPISELGFDPILSMPSLDEFTPQVLKRKAPIKAVLLDQSFSAGVGNWVAGKRSSSHSTMVSDTSRRGPLPRTYSPRTSSKYVISPQNTAIALLDC